MLMAVKAAVATVIGIVSVVINVIVVSATCRSGSLEFDIVAIVMTSLAVAEALRGISSCINAGILISDACISTGNSTIEVCLFCFWRLNQIITWYGWALWNQIRSFRRTAYFSRHKPLLLVFTTSQICMRNYVGTDGARRTRVQNGGRNDWSS